MGGMIVGTRPRRVEKWAHGLFAGHRFCHRFDSRGVWCAQRSLLEGCTRTVADGGYLYTPRDTMRIEPPPGVEPSITRTTIARPTRSEVARR